jgi:abortive infection bacteriophage resistance protein
MSDNIIQKKDPKPHKTYKQQIAILADRKMIIQEPKRALKKLSHVGYYRLSGYWYIARKENPTPNIQGLNNRLDDFEDNTTFEDIYKLYLFDKDLRLHLLCGIERIENYLKAIIAYELGRNHPCAHLDPNLFLTNTPKAVEQFNFYKNKLEKAINDSKDVFIRWNVDNYKDIPIWVVSEIWDFGMLSNIYKMLKKNYKEAICKRLNVSKSKDLENCLHTLNIIRNKCAHNARVWNCSIRPAVSRSLLDNLGINKLDEYSSTRLKSIILAIWSLTKRISRNSDWLIKMIELLETKPNVPNTNYYNMGFTQEDLSILKSLL